MKKIAQPTCNESNFVGNRREGCLDLVRHDQKTLREKYLIGPPRPCAAGSADELKHQGFVGLYLRPALRKPFRVAYEKSFLEFW
ncbi:MAG: hypothetical protein ABIR24_01820 [Verrucomicrobiota bacterium]